MGLVVVQDLREMRGPAPSQPKSALDSNGEASSTDGIGDASGRTCRRPNHLTARTPNGRNHKSTRKHTSG